MNKLLLALSLLLLSAVATAQSCPTKNIGGINYYVYTVEAGEGLFAVGRKFGVSQAQLHESNPHLREGLKVGQTLLIPVAVTSVTALQPDITSANYTEHTVVAQQTLYAISKIYGVSVEAIIAFNALSSEKIQVGQLLKIPVANPKQVTPQTTAKKKTVTHEVRARETLYSISKKYHISINELVEANPNVANGVNKGDVLHIPVAGEEPAPAVAPSGKSVTGQPNETGVNQSGIRHVVKQGETLYGISRRYELDVATLTEANPQSAKGIKTGDILVIPAQSVSPPEPQSGIPFQTTVHIVSDHETLYSISKMYGLSISELLSINKEIKETIKAGDILQVPLRLTSTTNAAVYDNFVTPLANKPHLKVAVLMAFMSDIANLDGSGDRFIEFYKGVLIALERIKKNGVSIELHVYDVGRSTTALDTLLKKPEMLVDLIIGPVFPEQVSLVSDFARQNGIYTVTPFTSHIEKRDKHHHLFQFNPSFEELFTTIAEQLTRLYAKHTFVIARFNGAADSKGNLFANALRQTLNSNRMAVHDIFITPDNADTLKTLIGNKKTVLILASNEQADVQPVIPRIKDLALNACTVWGFEEWRDLLTVFSDACYYSLFYSGETEAYSQTYHRWFGRRLRTGKPLYDLIGYDITYYFCSGIYKADNSVTLRLQPNIPMLQSRFNFVQESATGLYVNRSYCLIRWNGQSFEQPVFYE
ncbi:MAG: LysM peptidoglycan-binding domain-containing protein [Prevotellaceae bacterium]|jgi:LysM repeat protein|nr:LysM peptidoglycan-binding domain-containing protein [Prevotellaceae bacterium]